MKIKYTGKQGMTQRMDFCRIAKETGIKSVNIASSMSTFTIGYCYCFDNDMYLC